MPRFLTRIVALLLVPCLVGDPVTAAIFSPRSLPPIQRSQGPVIETQAITLTLGGALFATAITQPQAIAHVVHQLHAFWSAAAGYPGVVEMGGGLILGSVVLGSGMQDLFAPQDGRATGYQYSPQRVQALIVQTQSQSEAIRVLNDQLGWNPSPQSLSGFMLRHELTAPWLKKRKLKTGVILLPLLLPAAMAAQWALSHFFPAPPGTSEEGIGIAGLLLGRVMGPLFHHDDSSGLGQTGIPALKGLTVVDEESHLLSDWLDENGIISSPAGPRYGTAKARMIITGNYDPYRIQVVPESSWAGHNGHSIFPEFAKLNRGGGVGFPEQGSFFQVLAPTYRTRDGNKITVILGVQPSDGYRDLSLSQKNRLDTLKREAVLKIADWAHQRGHRVLARHPVSAADKYDWLDKQEIQKNYVEPFQDQKWGAQTAVVDFAHSPSSRPEKWYVYLPSLVWATVALAAALIMNHVLPGGAHPGVLEAGSGLIVGSAILGRLMQELLAPPDRGSGPGGAKPVETAVERLADLMAELGETSHVRLTLRESRVVEEIQKGERQARRIAQHLSITEERIRQIVNRLMLKFQREKSYRSLHAADLPFEQRPLLELDLDFKLLNVLRSVDTIGQLIEKTEKDLLWTRGMGRMRLGQIKAALWEKGRRTLLGSEPPHEISAAVSVLDTVLDKAGIDRQAFSRLIYTSAGSDDLFAENLLHLFPGITDVELVSLGYMSDPRQREGAEKRGQDLQVRFEKMGRIVRVHVHAQDFLKMNLRSTQKTVMIDKYFGFNAEGQSNPRYHRAIARNTTPGDVIISLPIHPLPFHHKLADQVSIPGYNDRTNFTIFLRTDQDDALTGPITTLAESFYKTFLADLEQPRTLGGAVNYAQRLIRDQWAEKPAERKIAIVGEMGRPLNKVSIAFSDGSEWALIGDGEGIRVEISDDESTRSERFPPTAAPGHGPDGGIKSAALLIAASFAGALHPLAGLVVAGTGVFLLIRWMKPLLHSIKPKSLYLYLAAA